MEHLWRCTGCNGWKRAKMWERFLIVIVCSSLQPRCVVAVFFSRACKGTLGSFVGAALANASWITKQYLQSEGEQIHTNTIWNSIRRNSDNIWVKGEMQFAFIDRFSDSCRCCAQVVSWLPSLLLWWHARWSKAALLHKEPCEKKMSENHSRRRHNLRQFKIICEAERPNALDGKIRLRLGYRCRSPLIDASAWLESSCIRALGLIRFQGLAYPSVGLEAHPHPRYKQVCDSHHQSLGWRVSGSAIGNVKGLQLHQSHIKITLVFQSDCF